MKRTALLSVVGAALGIVGLGTLAIAQVALPYVTSINSADALQDIPIGAPSSGNVYATALQLQNWILGGNSQRGTGTPALTACLTGGGTIVGTDSAFILTGGTTASTSCVATFHTAYVGVPVCNVTSQTAYATTTPSYAVTKTAVTITQTSEASEVYDVICIAQPGG